MDQPGPDRKDPEPPPDAPPPPPEPAAVDPDSGSMDATAAYETSPDAAPFAAAVETDTAVETEAVEPPPVTLYVPEERPGRRQVGRVATALIAVVGIAVVAGVGFFGYSLNESLAATRGTLAETESELGTTKATLESTEGDLATTTGELTTAQSERADLDAQVADLSAQVANQAECVTLQTDALDELGRISQLQTDNNNRTSEGSTWDRAEKKRTAAISAALEAYYQAYSKSFDGNSSSAKAWAAKGKEALGIIAVQAKQQLAEFGLIDSKAAEILAAIDALEAKLTELESTCKEVN
jgi:hypothetical protein